MEGRGSGFFDRINKISEREGLTITAVAGQADDTDLHRYLE
jgi:hypothetical protein